jgi:hypothetical protein
LSLSMMKGGKEEISRPNRGSAQRRTAEAASKLAPPRWRGKAGQATRLPLRGGGLGSRIVGGTGQLQP